MGVGEVCLGVVATMVVGLGVDDTLGETGCLTSGNCKKNGCNQEIYFGKSSTQKQRYMLTEVFKEHNILSLKDDVNIDAYNRMQ